MEDVHVLPDQGAKDVAQAKCHNHCVQSRPHNSHLEDSIVYRESLLLVYREYGAKLVEELWVVELIGGVKDDGWDEDMLDQVHRQPGK